jgi:asparagine synthase (glutamine-hydrolysing)
LLSLAGTSEAAYASAIGVTAPGMRDGLYSADFKTRGDYRAEDAFIATMAKAQARSASTGRNMPTSNSGCRATS